MIEKTITYVVPIVIFIVSIAMKRCYKSGKSDVLAGSIGMIMVALMISFLWYAIVV